MKPCCRFVTITFTLFACVVLSSSAFAQDIQNRIRSATNNANQDQVYDLQYKFVQGQELTWDTEHTAKTNNRASGKTGSSSVRTTSVKRWTVKSVEGNGDTTFVPSFDSIAMWQQVDEGEPASYDSTKDEKPSVEFTGVDEKIKKPLAVLTISKFGEILERKSESRQAKFGVGDACIPLPQKAIPVGARWFVATSYDVKDDDSKRIQLKARINYQLTKVKDNNAYISFKTEVLTPIESPIIRSQLLQQINDGYLVFDIANGRHIRKEVEWNEKVQGHQGPDSYLQYTGRLSETFSAATAKKVSSSNIAAPNSAAKLRELDGKPIIRK